MKDNVIYYDSLARKWCKRQEIEMEYGLFDKKLNKRITKIFQWDLELNLIC